jgi:hypothetical protein
MVVFMTVIFPILIMVLLAMDLVEPKGKPVESPHDPE